MKHIIVKIFAIVGFLLSYGCMKAAFHGGGIVFWLAAVALSGLGTFLLRKSKQLKQKKGEELLKTDKRPPFLYLRSFQHDAAAATTENDSFLAKVISTGLPQNLSSEEEQLAAAVAHYGPFVAIGDPQETSLPIGASRIYKENTEWQEAVLKLVEAARLVMLRVGSTPGFWWEVKTVLARKEPRKIIFLLPTKLPQYLAFKARVEEEFQLVLPADYQPISVRNQSFSAVLLFDSDWQPLIVHCKERASWLLHNGVAADFKEILAYVLSAPAQLRPNHFTAARSQMQRTPLAKVQRVGNVLFLGLIISALLTGCVKGCTHNEAIKAGSPTMLIIWGIVSALLYALIVYGEKLPDN